MARAFPEGVRKLRDAGHTIGTHSQNHPLTMNKMPIERAKEEIDDGIASVKAALGDDADKSLAPFFRIPGLMRAEAVEDYLASQGIQTWSADFPADDWRHISSSRVYDLAIQRIEAKGKGILLLHDIQARTVAALPRILQRAEGARLSHRPCGAGDAGAAGDADRAAAMAVASDVGKRGDFALAQNPQFRLSPTPTCLPAPSLSDFDWLAAEPIAFAEPFDRRRTASRAAFRCRGKRHGPSHRRWRSGIAAITLPVPAQSIFEIPDGSARRRAAAAACPRVTPNRPHPADPKRASHG